MPLMHQGVWGQKQEIRGKLETSQFSLRTTTVSQRKKKKGKNVRSYLNNCRWIKEEDERGTSAEEKRIIN